jgi:predicted metal-dependent phosphotriesterase family hydrolase
VFTHFLPLLRERGVTPDQTDTMLRRNPTRLLSLLQ